MVLSAWLVIVSPGAAKVRREGQEKEHSVLEGLWGSGRKTPRHPQIALNHCGVRGAGGVRSVE